MRAVTAVLFLAACAYMGVGLYDRLCPGAETVTVRLITVTDSLSLRGIALRYEQALSLSPGAEVFASAGERLPSGAPIARISSGDILTSPGSAVFFDMADGYEYLSPELAEGLTPESFDNIWNAPARDCSRAAGRLVYDFCWYFAAVADLPADIPEGAALLLAFDGLEMPQNASLISISADDDRAALLLRLVSGGDCLSLRRAEAELIFSRHTGLALPRDAVHTDEQGNNFVYTLTAGIVERKAVEIIYTADELCLAAVETRAEALREGNTLIVSGENIFEGRIIHEHS